jgi:DNA-binding response OmpR family regulator
MPAGKPAPGGRVAERAEPTVLIVDDDQVMLRLLATTFRGARVLQARTAVAGLRLAREERPRLVFLDVRLGGEDGVRLCRLLKAEPETRAIRVFMLSADDSPRTRLRARDAGADGFFAKPFSPLALWRALDESVGV